MRRWRAFAIRRMTLDRDARRLAGSRRRVAGAARRWRHDRLGLDHAAAGRSARCAGRSSDHPGDDGAGRGLSRRPLRGPVSRAGEIRRYLAARSPLQARDVRANPHAQAGGLVARREGGPGERRGGRGRGRHSSPTRIRRLYTDPGEYIDSDHPAVQAVRRRRRSQPTPATARRPACSTQAVRDGIRYNPYVNMRAPETFRASSVLAAGIGYCVGKAALYAAACRVHGIPARAGFADVRNHLDDGEAAPEHGLGPLHLARLYGSPCATAPGARRPRPSTPRCAPRSACGRSTSTATPTRCCTPSTAPAAPTCNMCSDRGSYHDVPAKFLMREMAPRLRQHAGRRSFRPRHGTRSGGRLRLAV